MKKIFLLAGLIFFLGFSVKASAEEYNCAAGIHKFETTIVDATETEPGSVTYTCEMCGYTYTESIAPYGHDWGPWVTDQESDCVHEGRAYRACRNNPEHVEEEILPATGIHNFTMTEKEPTTEEAGSRTYTCSVCGFSYSEELPALTAIAEDTEAAAPKADAAGSREEQVNTTSTTNSACSFNAMDYALCSGEVFLVVFLSLLLRSKRAIIKWDRELWKINSGAKKRSEGGAS